MHATSWKLLLMGATALAATAAGSSVALAQAAPAAESTTNLGEIVVQARRRSEAIVDVPLAISVVSEQKLQQLDINSTTDLVNYTPGVTFNSFTAGNARNDRGPDRPIIMRGLNLGIGNQAGAALFLNGAAVSGNEVPASMDVGQVEVLRGPQSVYFGRATLTGAIAYSTRSIGDELEAEVEVKVAEQDERTIEGTIAGPLIPGILKARLTGLTQEYGGYVTNSFNNGGANLGATSRDSISTTLIFTPIEAVEMKAYVNYFRDDDGPSATAFVPPNFANCRFPGSARPTICGEIPGRANSINYKNTVIPQYVADVVFSTPLIKNAEFDSKLGSQREVLNADLVASWQINDYLRVESITGYHDAVHMTVDDGLGQPFRAGFPDINYMYSYTVRREDRSQEIRLSSDPDRRLSWVLGGNYIQLETAISAYVAWINAAGVGRNFRQAIIPNKAETTGVFGGVYFNVTEALKVSAEARRQVDDISIPGNSASFRSFSPRVSVNYDIGGNRNLYASYAEGNSPGGFNTSISPYKNNPVAFAQIQSLLGVSSDFFKEQKLAMYEVGFKGYLSDGKGYFDINAYTGTLTNQQLRNAALIPALGFSVSVTNNAGESKIHGVEFQGNYNFTDNLSLSTTFAWNHNERTKYFNVAGVPQFGTTDFNGKEFAFVPEFSGSAVLSYTRPITDEWEGFSNASLVYRGRQFADDFNAAYIPQRYQVDVRAGVKNERYSAELFVKNLLDDQNYTGGGVTPDFGASGGAYSFFGAWAQPRQVGIRLNAKL
jgi:iron complex outermembrane recepter protein